VNANAFISNYLVDSFPDLFAFFCDKNQEPWPGTKKSGKLSTKKLETNAFANAVDSDETDSDNDNDKTVKYHGATTYYANDEKIVTFQIPIRSYYLKFTSIKHFLKFSHQSTNFVIKSHLDFIYINLGFN
jgi:hypothetical protein